MSLVFSIPLKPAISLAAVVANLSLARFDAEKMRKNVYFAHREPRDFSDRVALFMVRMLRWGMDTATRYKHDVEEPKKIGDENAVTATKPYHMNERKWLVRMVFLESVAGVPGMVAGMLRHLHSLRRMKRDNGWIETLLEEATTNACTS